MDYGSATVEIAGKRGTATLRLMVPCTFRLMQWGLQGHRSLGPREGMMFASRNWPREEQISMWQAKVPFELAMLWIDADGIVQDVELTAPGDRRTYDHRGLYVVEANAALAPEIGILPGDAEARLSWRDPCPRMG